jgi:hypothetical protein
MDEMMRLAIDRPSSKKWEEEKERIEISRHRTFLSAFFSVHSAGCKRHLWPRLSGLLARYSDIST